MQIAERLFIACDCDAALSDAVAEGIEEHSQALMLGHVVNTTLERILVDLRGAQLQERVGVEASFTRVEVLHQNRPRLHFQIKFFESSCFLLIAALVPTYVNIVSDQCPSYRHTSIILPTAVQKAQLLSLSILLYCLQCLLKKRLLSLSLLPPEMRFQDHFLLEAQETYVLKIARLSVSNRLLYPSSTGTYQDASHQFVKRASFQMIVSHFQGFLFENYLLAIILPDLPLGLHFLNFQCKFFLS